MIGGHLAPKPPPKPEPKKRKPVDRSEKEKPLLLVQGLLELNHRIVPPMNPEAEVITL